MYIVESTKANFFNTFELFDNTATLGDFTHVRRQYVLDFCRGWLIIVSAIVIIINLIILSKLMPEIFDDKFYYIIVG